MIKIEMVYTHGNVIVQKQDDIFYCMQLMLQNLNPYSSKLTLLENIHKIFETVYELSELLQEEYQESNKKLFRELSKFKAKITNIRKSIDYTRTKEDVLKLQYNIILAFEGLNLLHGFGACTKWGDKIDYFNPERTSIMGVL